MLLPLQSYVSRASRGLTGRAEVLNSASERGMALALTMTTRHREVAMVKRMVKVLLYVGDAIVRGDAASVCGLAMSACKKHHFAIWGPTASL